MLPRVNAAQTVTTGHVAFDAESCGILGPRVPAHEVVSTVMTMSPPANGRRAYRRSQKPPVKRWWRTREDPFAEVWSEVVAELEADANRTAKDVFEQLQALHRGRFPDGQLRTFQRRVQEWRRDALVVFRDPLLSEERLSGRALPEPLAGRRMPAAEELAG